MTVQVKRNLCQHPRAVVALATVAMASLAHVQTRVVLVTKAQVDLIEVIVVIVQSAKTVAHV
jgi:hypothetical protein